MSLSTVSDESFSLNSISYVIDKGDLFKNVKLEPANVERNFNCYWGCGIFELTRKESQQ
jgi:hypothetical protein